MITQPIFDTDQAAGFHGAVEALSRAPVDVPVFFGLQMLEQHGVSFSNVPDAVREELAKGKPGVKIALELYQRFQEAGIHNVYLVPPIRRGGARNYDAAREFLHGAAVVP